MYGGDVHIGIYVNTNKTADAGKDVLDRGYVIPWRHERVLYWLEKLRNWQEKYNPITQPTPWADLKPKHLGDVKSPQVLARMGMSCFLFRHAAASNAEDRHKYVWVGRLDPQGVVPVADVDGSIAMFALENRNKPLIVVSESHPILNEGSEWSPPTTQGQL
ncbi:integrase family protein [Pseudomonas sp. MOB-449]|nr:integrase family protein [Pseudomonas sp. MOB-449]